MLSSDYDIRSSTDRRTFISGFDRNKAVFDTVITGFQLGRFNPWSPFANPYKIDGYQMNLVFTDLDGTLLDHQTYDWTPAQPSLNYLHKIGSPCVFVTSKTRAEVEFWRSAIGNRHPFIVENGAAAYIPLDYFPGDVTGSVLRGGYAVLEWGTPYPKLVRALDEASQASGCPVAGFHGMSVEEVAADAGLTLDQAALAKQREYDEPFRSLDTKRTQILLDEIARKGLRWTEGGRYFHIIGNNDKALAVKALISLYEKSFGPVTTFGLGDGPNDLQFLEIVDFPIIIQSKSAVTLSQQLPRAKVTQQPGPVGWNEAILELTGQR